ncbi:Flp family type IVb pilin [Ectobacillus ponti]|uniref:Flp family type IVb pilin n=1 Tax=Ectobacillus ponti TaxID=2961894 RepID=A0AA41X9S0_9BACI|nr:Flp family type IVb pilin [Ectobacillus ponti]MCP8969319.1 Flp family type IVb pilin [Ectobacillus ponti]
MWEKTKHFAVNEDGQGMTEYGLILALVAVVAAAALTPLGTAIKAKFNDVVTHLGGTPAP